MNKIVAACAVLSALNMLAATAEAAKKYQEADAQTSSS